MVLVWHLHFPQGVARLGKLILNFPDESVIGLVSLAFITTFIFENQNTLFPTQKKVTKWANKQLTNWQFLYTSTEGTDPKVNICSTDTPPHWLHFVQAMAWYLPQCCRLRNLCHPFGSNSRCPTNPRPGGWWSKTHFCSSLWCSCAVCCWGKPLYYFSSMLNTHI